MNAFTIAATSLRRYLRDRTAMFFVVALPVLVIIIVGATVSGIGKFRITVVDQGSGPIGQSIAVALERDRGLDVHHSSSLEAARTSVRRGEVQVAVVLPAGLDAALRRGEHVDVAVLGDAANSGEQAALSAVDAVVAAESGRIQAALFAASEAGGTVDQNLAQVAAAERLTAPVTVTPQSVDTTRNFLPEGFSYSAPTMLVLFVFINALAAGSAIIQSRQLGMYQRMLAAPVSTRTILGGEAICYLSMSLLQSVLIVGVGAIAFGVDWGNPLAAVVLVMTWALVGTGAGMLSGTLFRTSEQASSIGPSLGIAFGMLGGCMWPLEIVPSFMRTLGHFFPHAWAVDAWTILLSRGGDLPAIGGQLAVLAGFAVVLLSTATVRLRHSISD